MRIQAIQREAFSTKYISFVTSNLKRSDTNINNDQSFNNDNNMGQAIRTIRYDRAANEANAITVLEFAKQPLKWHRLDDGVMGGQSETQHQHEVEDENGILNFTGAINTEGGGFCSVRAPISGLPPDTTAIRLVFRGDGKTYKFIMTNRERGGGNPFSKFPSFQADVATKSIDNENDWQEVTLPLDKFLPAFGGRMTAREEKLPDDSTKKYKLHPTEMTELGLMLSLKLSDGTPNPKETFGEGIFPFSLRVKAVEPIVATNEIATAS